MTTSHPTRSAHDFNDLPEPARSQAVATFQDLIEEGRTEQEADHQARELARNWLSERVPTVTSSGSPQEQ